MVIEVASQQEWGIRQNMMRMLSFYLMGLLSAGAFVLQDFCTPGLLSVGAFVRGAFFGGAFVRGAFVRGAFILHSFNNDPLRNWTDLCLGDPSCLCGLNLYGHRWGTDDAEAV